MVGFPSSDAFEEEGGGVEKEEAGGQQGGARGRVFTPPLAMVNCGGDKAGKKQGGECQQ